MSSQVQVQPEKVEKRSRIISVKTAFIIVVIMLLGVLAYVNKGLFIAATVNGNPISRLDIVKKLEKGSGKNLLESLIVEKLVQNEADAKKIVVSNDEVETELKKIEDEVAMQGSKLDDMLTERGMSRDDLKKQIVLNKQVEKLLGDKLSVTDEEVEQYITDNKISLPYGQEAETKNQLKDGLRSQKLNTQAQALIAELKSKAKIKYFVNY